MRCIQIFKAMFSAFGVLGFSCQVADAGSDYDECVMGKMVHQNIYMLPLAQKICREQFPPQAPPPPAPIETVLTQQIHYDVCSQPGSELAICIPNPPGDEYITRVIAYFTNASPCMIDYTGTIPYTSSSYAGYKTLIKYNPRELSEGLFLTTGEKSMFSNTYYFVYNNKMKNANCYRVEILGYRNCYSSVFSSDGYRCN